MKKLFLIPLLAVAGLAIGAAPLSAQPAAGAADAALRAGKNFIPTPVFPPEADAALLRLYAGLRVADVTDGLDAAGLQGVGLVDPEIHPLWKDLERFTHRFAGIAVTARYVPAQDGPAGTRTIEQYDAWAGEWYDKKSPETFLDLLRPGAALVIEDAPDADVGSIGSYNILEWVGRGCVGVVTSATARDTDEIALERVPLYLRRPGRGIRPGRNVLESVNRPIVCGGALVVPGDVVVADGDGVVIVPRAKAEAVALYARKIMEGDKEGRRELYKSLKLKEDESVRK